MAIAVARFDLPMIVAAPLAILAAVAFGLVLAIPTLRLRAGYLAIATMAAGEIVRYLALNLQDITGGAAGTVNILGPGLAADYTSEWLRFQKLGRGGISAIAVFRLPSEVAMIAIVWPVTIALLALAWYLVRSPWGRVLRAIREHEEAATALGKDVFR